MNLWLRMLWYLLTVRSRSHIALPQESSLVRFRVLPTDLDTSGHMNNGRYLTLMDFGRLDIMVGSGLWRSVLRYKWTPIANAVMIRFRRELKLFQRFRLESRILAWETTTVPKLWAINCVRAGTTPRLRRARASIRPCSRPVSIGPSPRAGTWTPFQSQLRRL